MFLMFIHHSCETNVYVVERQSSQVKIVRNFQINVPYGREVYLNPKNLTISYDIEGHCQVYILKNDPMSSQLGKITPSSFPCKFDMFTLSYQHFGSLTRTTDTIRLQVRLDTKDETIIAPFTIQVKVIFTKPLDILQKVQNLFVDDIGGLSDPIDPKILNVRYTKENQVCTICFLPRKNGPPFFGSIVNTSDGEYGLNLLRQKEYKYIPCDDFLSGMLRYAHQRRGRSSNRDYVPLMVELSDRKTEAVQKREFIQVPVRIRRAPENTPPIVNYNSASYSLQVDQIVLTALTSTVLKAEDRETESGSIIFNVTTRNIPGEGYLVHTDDPTRPLTTFYQKEIDQLKIAFKPPDKLSTSQRLQQVWLEARDSYGASSQPFYVIIVIKPMNTYAPQVIKNSGLAMFEGQSRPITKDVLKIRDPDNEEDVKIVVVGGLFHGKLEKNGKEVSHFTINDIDNKLVRYVHDDSDTYSDSLLIQISDGTNSVDLLFVITIVPVDDEPPVLAYNTGVTVDEGSVVKINQFDLSARDVDSDDTKVLFKVVDPPVAGVLFRVNTNRGVVVRDGNNQDRITEFSQVDVILGRIFYRHFGEEIFNDVFTFRLSDGAEPPNESGLKTFIIDVIPKDDLQPTLHVNCPLKMKVIEGKHKEFSKQVLQYTDGDSLDESLRYVVTNKPYFVGDTTGETNAGRIAFSHQPQKEISSFTQKQVNHFKVIYVPPLTEIGVKTRQVLFNFTVSDDAANSVAGQTFIIDIQPVNNMAPVAVINAITLKEGKRGLISAQQLRAYDPDNLNEELSFGLKKLPKHGQVLLNKQKLTIGASFSMDDIKQVSVEYVHDSSETTADEIKLILTDTVHMVHIGLPVVITPSDDERPVLKLLKKKLTVRENGVVKIASDVMEVTDKDSADEKLTFLVTKSLQHGQLQVKGEPTDTFKLTDILSGFVSYKHTGGEIGTKHKMDLLNLTLTDMSEDLFIGGNLISGILIEVVIEPVDSEPPTLSGTFLVEVDEGGKTVIEKQQLKITDADTNLKHVLCNINKFPKYGFIETSATWKGSEVTQLGIPVKAFSAYGLKHGYISYVQSKHKKIEPVMDELDIRCSDGSNTASTITINVVISPTNDEVPMIFVQPNIICVEDDLILLDLSKINPYDQDQPEDNLTITVTKQPINGELLLQKTTELKLADVFTKTALMGDLDATVMYQHKGTETTSDSFELRVDDGIHNVTKVVNITVISMDDETPRLTVNTGLRLDRGETKVITTYNLKAVDLDSNDDSLMYYVMMKPVYGKLQRVISPSMTVDINKGGNFSQHDINTRKIRYTHTSEDVGDREIIRLDVTDGFNRLINQMFNIMITPLDNIMPDIVNQGVTLKENKRVILTTDMLSASDLNTPDENLQFIITKTPLKGYVEHLDNVGFPITKFSQLDLASNKISYVHNSLDETNLDNFEFEVTDGRNKVYRTFRINIGDVNNKKPTLHRQIIKALRGQKTVITPFELKAVDNDTEATHVRFKIHDMPKHGKILLNSQPVIVFSQYDLDMNKISYQHDRSLSKSDSFSVTATDGRHTDFFVSPDRTASTIHPVKIHIEIKEVDTHAPVLVTNTGASSLRVRRSYTLFKFTSSYLKAEDHASAASNIKFSIKHQPKHGKIVRMTNKKKPVRKFTQEDINKKQIAYVLDVGSVAVNDFFHFDIYDEKKNVLYGQTFHFKWSWVSIANSHYKANETDKHVKLDFHRNGYLGTTSFVTVEFVHRGKNNQPNTRSKRQIQFGRGQTKASFQFSILDDGMYEKVKSVKVLLKKSYNGLVSTRNNATIEIYDPEDEPTVMISERVVRISESIGTVNIPIRRKGDVSNIIRIKCVTRSDTANGTDGSKVTSYRDYISRYADDRSSIITFQENEIIKFCPVKIIDDSLYEGEENFKVEILSLYGGRVADSAATCDVIIKEDAKDEPRFSFSSGLYNVEEKSGFVKISVKRVGTDLSMTSYVLFATRQNSPVSAKAYSDYHPLVTSLRFNPDETEKVVKVKILDDTGRVRLEGKEHFGVLIRTPRNGRLGELSEATVIIDDTKSDQPRVYFAQSDYSVKENVGNVTILLEREGDLRHHTYVRCYTRQMSARVNEDFIERRNTNVSFVKFERKEHQAKCQVTIINDNTYESDERFKVVLGKSKGGIVTDVKTEAVVKVIDDDVPVIGFEEKRFYVREPSSSEKVRTITIPVQRKGDASKASYVTVHTKDGSARSGKSFEPLAKRLEFDVNVTQVDIDVTVYYVADTNLRTAFSLVLTSDGEHTYELGQKKAVIFIEEIGHRVGVTFPLKPVVASLMDYNRIEKPRKMPAQGYPVICVTACNPRHPRYDEIKSICKEELINDNFTKYRWQVAAPDYTDGIENKLKDVNMKLFYTSPNQITLDSVYFSAGSRIRCIAQPFSEDGNTGVESSSDVIVINPTVGLCTPKRASDIGAETFSAQVAYTGASHPTHKNMIKIKVLIPHFDGLLPVISTKRLSNFELTLSPDASRVAQHTCSNILNPGEVTTQYGFNTKQKQNNIQQSNSQPFEFDWRLRGNDTTRFYNHLNLDACLWTFVSYFNMTELVQTCGGKIVTDGMVKDAVQSHLAINLPLFVSYIYHSPNDEDGWTDFNHQSSIRLTAVYNTGILWKDGVGLPEKAKLKGNLYPASIIVRKNDRKLQMNFRTKARFRGLFVLQTRDGKAKSEVVLRGRPGLPFTLKLIRSDPTYAEPEQLWQMESKYAVRDYTGSYVFKMIPCTVSGEEEFSLPPDCTPGEPVSFNLNFTIQQTSEPVEASFTLNTRFFLLNSREQWLSSRLSSSQVTDVYFKEEEKIFGRVMVDPSQSLGNAYHTVIEKVFLCSGLDGFIPTFDPATKNYGCVADSSNLMYRFKVLDRLNPETEQKSFGNIDFKALLAVDDPEADDLVNQAGSDGFRIESTPLFKVSAGRNWFLHVIYTLRSQQEKNRGLGRRSIDVEHYHALSTVGKEKLRRRRELSGESSREIRSIGHEKGTNIQMILLDRPNIEANTEKNPEKEDGGKKHDESPSSNLLIIIIVILLILILVGLILGAVFIKRKSAASGGDPQVSGEDGGTAI